jgi:glycolate oxidase iron-sulfur subunit
MIEKSGADIVAAECSACRVQICNSLYENKSLVEFKNPIELIAEALD